MKKQIKVMAAILAITATNATAQQMDIKGFKSGEVFNIEKAEERLDAGMVYIEDDGFTGYQTTTATFAGESAEFVFMVDGRSGDEVIIGISVTVKSDSPYNKIVASLTRKFGKPSTVDNDGIGWDKTTTWSRRGELLEVKANELDDTVTILLVNIKLLMDFENERNKPSDDI